MAGLRSKAARTALGAFVLLAGCAVSSLAQSGVVSPRLGPDATVRGSGVVNIGPTSALPMQLQAIFHLDIAVSGNQSQGGFLWTELRPNGARNTYVVARKILGTKFTSSNYAIIQAEGLLNGRPATITIEALDDLDMDWIHVHAQPTDSKLPDYDKAGGVARGGIVIWHRPAVTAEVKGAGSIKIERRGVPTPLAQMAHTGNFVFSAANTSDGTTSTLLFQELSPLTQVSVLRPIALVHIPKVTSLRIEGNLAYIQGPGLLNGKPVWVYVEASDTSKPIAIGDATVPNPPDHLSITCTALGADSLLPIYQAAGDVFRGDIAITRASVTAP